MKKLTKQQVENQSYGKSVKNKYLRIKGEYALDWLNPEYFAGVFNRTTARLSQAFSGKAPGLARKIDNHLDLLEAREIEKRKSPAVSVQNNQNAIR